MTVENFVPTVSTVFEKIETRKISVFWANFGYVCHIQSYDFDVFAHAKATLVVE